MKEIACEMFFSKPFWFSSALFALVFGLYLAFYSCYNWLKSLFSKNKRSV